MLFVDAATFTHSYLRTARIEREYKAARFPSFHCAENACWHKGEEEEGERRGVEGRKSTSCKIHGSNLRNKEEKGERRFSS